MKSECFSFFSPPSRPCMIRSTKACLACCPNLMWAEGRFHAASLSQLKQQATRPNPSASSPFNYTPRPYSVGCAFTPSPLSRVHLIFQLIQRSYRCGSFRCFCESSKQSNQYQISFSLRFNDPCDRRKNTNHTTQ